MHTRRDRKISFEIYDSRFLTHLTVTFDSKLFYVHCFFSLGDGSRLRKVSYPPFSRAASDNGPYNPCLTHTKVTRVAVPYVIKNVGC